MKKVESERSRRKLLIIQVAVCLAMLNVGAYSTSVSEIKKAFGDTSPEFQREVRTRDFFFNWYIDGV